MDLHEFKQAMTHKLGPLPVWVWGTLAGGGVALVMHRKGGGTSKDPNAANGPLVPGAQGDVTTLPAGNGLTGGGGGGGLNDGFGNMLPATDPAAAFDWQSLLDLLATPIDPVYKTAQTATPVAAAQQNPASYAAMPILPGSGIAGSDPQLGLFEPGGRYFVPHALGPSPAQVARALQSRQQAPVIYTSSDDTATLATPSSMGEPTHIAPVQTEGPNAGQPFIPSSSGGAVVAF